MMQQGLHLSLAVQGQIAQLTVANVAMKEVRPIYAANMAQLLVNSHGVNNEVRERLFRIHNANLFLNSSIESLSSGC